MSTSAETPKAIHQGRNVKRFREMMGLKQEALAEKLGGNWTQRKLSYVETREVIEQDLLEDLARALKVSPEALKNFDEDKAIFLIQNNYDNSTNHQNFQPIINQNSQPDIARDKYVTVVEKNDQLVEENRKLYEALLKAEREKIALLERLLKEKG